jgi:hypothetical protein
MTLTTTKLTRAAGLCAVAAGLVFIGVQINHPPLDVTFVTRPTAGGPDTQHGPPDSQSDPSLGAEA